MFGALLFPDGLSAPGAGKTEADASAPPGPIFGEPQPEGIDQLAFLVGGVWVAQSGSATVSERVTWDAEHAFLLTEVTQMLGGKVAGQARGSFGYSPTRRYLMSGATSTSGTYTGGYETGSTGGASWIFAMTIGSGATIQNVQVTMSNPSPDSLVIAQATLQNGAWVTQSAVTYTRQACS
jgi:hypothetical protein